MLMVNFSHPFSWQKHFSSQKPADFNTMLTKRIINSVFSNQLIRCYPTLYLSSRWDNLSRRHYAKAVVSGIASLGKKTKLGKAGPVIEKKVIPVETDTKRLVAYCCGSNIYKEGEDIKLKEDSEYPDWLWKLNTGKPIPLDQMDPNTEEYWTRVRTMSKRRWTSMLKLQKVK